MLNPFFLQGSKGEQGLVQDLVNEQLRMYGIECHYIPRKLVTSRTIMKEVTESRFDQAFPLEAYLMNIDGYAGQGDILTKFGVRVTDEATFVISKERFEEAVAPFLEQQEDDYELSNRPKEGDLIFFPLGKRMFEIKFVEHERPFYQLQKNYVYQLQCELFEYEDEVIDTSIDIIDTQVADEGYITTLQLVGVGVTATANPVLGTGYVRELFLNNDGSGFTGTPTVAISTSPTGNFADNASAVAITSTRANITSIDRLILTNAGAGYTETPTITITGGGGTGAAATCSINTASSGVIRFIITEEGVGYGTAPTVTVSNPALGIASQRAVGIASLGANSSGFNQVNSIFVSNPGENYDNTATVTLSLIHI